MVPAGGTRTILRALGAALVVALLAGVGCGGTAEAPDSSGGTAATPAPTTAPAPAVAPTTAPPATRPPEPATEAAPTQEDVEAADGSNGDGEHEPVPDVRFRYFDGSEGTLADFAGTPTVINFWASWCPPCITEMPAFEAVHIELTPQVAFLGFNVGDDPGEARELAERTGVTYPLAEDPDSTIFQNFGGFGMPTTVFVDRQGMIVHMISSRLRAQDLRGLIAEHLGV